MAALRATFMPTQDEDFYRRAPTFDRFADVPDLDRYTVVPATWCLVVTDVRGSTRAIEEGRYKDVNALGVASIVAIRNALPDVDFPYVFGGDGATILVPRSRSGEVEAALRGVRRAARDVFDLALRVGIVPIADISAAGHEVRVARLRVNASASFAMLGGSGITIAEQWLKDDARGGRYEVSDEGAGAADFSGFECRWQPVPSRRGLSVSLLVRALSPDPSEAASSYRRVIDEIDRIAGRQGGPVTASALRVAPPTASFTQEAGLKASGTRGLRFRASQLRVRVQSLIGGLLMARGWSAAGLDGKSYRQEVADNTDFRKFDDMLRMVLDMTRDEHRQLMAYLEGERERGALVYGVHTSDSALMTCIVGAYQGDHVHFVDGSGGGYALAAKQLKLQLG